MTHNLRRAVVALLCLALVPALMFVTSTAAEASTPGPPKMLHFDVGSIQYKGAGVSFGSCDLQAFYRQSGTATTVAWNSFDCDAGTLSFAGVVWDNSTTGMTFKGTDDSGQGCTLSASARAMTSSGGVPDSAASMFPLSGDCNVAEACYSVSWQHRVWVGDDKFFTASECMPFDLGKHPTDNADPKSSTCQYGTPQWAFGKTIPEYPGFPGWRMASTVDWKGYTNSAAVWKITTVWRDSAGNISRYDADRTAYPSGSSDAGYYGPPDVVDYATGHVKRSVITGQFGTNGLVVVGVQVRMNNGPTAWGGLQPEGYTRPDVCSFYFGEKIVQDTATTEDEPFAALSADLSTAGQTPEPAPVAKPPASSCTFSLLDASTWLSGGMCAAVGLLGAIYGVLGSVAGTLAGLAAAIIGPIVDAIQALGIAAVIVGVFTPHPDQWGWEQVVDQAQARPPASVVVGAAEGASGIADGFKAAGGCATFVDFGADLKVTCTQVKDAGGMGALYSLVQFGLYAMTGLGLLVMFHKALEAGS